MRNDQSSSAITNTTVHVSQCLFITILFTSAWHETRCVISLTWHAALRSRHAQYFIRHVTRLLWRHRDSVSSVECVTLAFEQASAETHSLGVFTYSMFAIGAVLYVEYW